MTDNHVHEWCELMSVFTGDEILDVRYCDCGSTSSVSWQADPSFGDEYYE